MNTWHPFLYWTFPLPSNIVLPSHRIWGILTLPSFTCGEGWLYGSCHFLIPFPNSHVIWQMTFNRCTSCLTRSVATRGDIARKRSNTCVDLQASVTAWQSVMVMGRDQVQNKRACCHLSRWACRKVAKSLYNKCHGHSSRTGCAANNIQLTLYLLPRNVGFTSNILF